MRIAQHTYEAGGGWQAVGTGALPRDAQLVLVFGGRMPAFDGARYEELRALYAKAHVVFCSTSGEIVDTEVTDGRLAATALQLEHTAVEARCHVIDEASCSYDAGRLLSRALTREKLKHVLVFSDGQRVNGTDLARGFNEHLPPGVLLTGGLAGDGVAFECTRVGLDGEPAEGNIVAVGFYGDRLRVGFGSSGGWIPFGPARLVTRSEGNVLYELDGHSALGLYREYLGEQAAGLPGAALRFPLSMTTASGDQTVVRTILSIDEITQSMTFAGDIPVGTSVRFMRASYEELVDGAALAAEQSMGGAGLNEADFALCVSCVGRKIVMGQRIEDETEIVRDILGERPAIAGFYSYGELAPPEAAQWCELHNQTMTITLMKEV